MTKGGSHLLLFQSTLTPGLCGQLRALHSTCLVTASNPTFPACKFPDERPIYTKENCHSYDKVLWNVEVLQKEEELRRLVCSCFNLLSPSSETSTSRQLASILPKGFVTSQTGLFPLFAGRSEAELD